jgi:hypothetical protein
MSASEDLEWKKIEDMTDREVRSEWIKKVDSHAVDLEALARFLRDGEDNFAHLMLYRSDRQTRDNHCEVNGLYEKFELFDDLESVAVAIVRRACRHAYLRRDYLISYDVFVREKTFTFTVAGGRGKGRRFEGDMDMPREDGLVFIDSLNIMVPPRPRRR